MPFFGLPRRMKWLCLSSLVVECAGPAPQRPLCFRCLSTVDPTRKRQREGSMFCFCFKLNISSPKGSGPRSEVVLYRNSPWLGWGKPSSKNQFNISAQWAAYQILRRVCYRGSFSPLTTTFCAFETADRCRFLLQTETAVIAEWVPTDFFETA